MVPNVACRQLGFGRGLAYGDASGSTAEHDQEDGFVGVLWCEGSEASLADCGVLPSGYTLAVAACNEGLGQWIIHAVCEGV